MNIIILLLIVLLLILIIIFGLMFFKNLKSKSVKLKSNKPSSQKLNANYLTELYNTNGLLISMTPVSHWCKEFNSKSLNCIDINACTLADPADLTALLNTNLKGDLTCFSFDVGLLHYKLPNVVFGPIEGIEYHIGLIFDYNILKKYIVCLGSIDLGSVDRYGSSEDQLKHAKTITPSMIKSNQKYNELLEECKKDYKKCGLIKAGCGYSGTIGATPYNNNSGYNFSNIPYLPIISEDGYIPSNWSGYNFNIHGKYKNNSLRMFDRNHFNEWLETTINIHKILAEQVNNESTCPNLKFYWQGNYPALKNSTCDDYWSYQFRNPKANGYRENEFDLFFPNICSDKNKCDKSCNPYPEVIDDWKKAIIGIFTTNVCLKNVRYLKESGNDCCNNFFNEQLVGKLVEKYNQHNINKINGYIINVIKPDEDYSEWVNNNYISKLNIKQITNY